MIRVEGLRFDYPGTRALDGVSFALERGSVTALVGPNGAGKTTLLRCLAGLDAPHAGRALIDDVDVGEDPRNAHRKLGFLPDHFGLYAELSARRCLLHAGASHGLEGDDLSRRVTETAQLVGLSDKLEAKAGSLSRGQRQRLALAQVILHRPKVLLLDEPASGLDPEARAGLAGLMRALSADGMTLIVSSHILAELEEYCTGMLVLSKGSIIEHRAAPSARPAAGDAADPQIAPLRRLKVGLAQALDVMVMDTFLGNMPGSIESSSIEGRTLWFKTRLTDAELPGLLKTLLDAGLPVCEFTIVTESLQQQYLAAVREGSR